MNQILDHTLLTQQLSLKKMQINKLLQITQAINDNQRAEDLYAMYQSFLGWEFGVKKKAFFIKKNGDWTCVLEDGISPFTTKLLHHPTVQFRLFQFEKRQNIEAESGVLEEFDFIIPVFHKDEPIAYALIGDISEEIEGIDAKIDLITTVTNLIAVAIENKRLFKRQIEKERLDYEMKLAGEMQMSLVPDSLTLPHSDFFELASIYQPFMGIGGDYFDCIEYKTGKYLLCIGDISGKGLAAALLMASFQANLHTLVRRPSFPDHFIHDLNEAVLRITKGDKYITFFVAELDTIDKKIRYVNAGHVPPILVQENNLHRLTEGCTILGYFKKLPKVEIGEIDLVDKDTTLVIFTDGITDVKDEHGNTFDEQNLINLVSQNADLTAGKLNDKLMETLIKFKGDEGFTDDIAVLTCRTFR